MRLIQISPQINTANTVFKTLRIKTPNKKNLQEKQETNSPIFLVPYSGYIPSFKGYSEDKEFINTAINMLDNMIDDVNSILRNNYEDSFNNDFLQALEYAKQDKELYAKITETPELFDKISAVYDIFNESLLKSVDEVRFDKKQFTHFWENSSRIGGQKTSDIIKSAVNKKDENLNKILKKSDDKDYEIIKSTLIKEWFNSAYDAIKAEKPETITKNFEELSKTVSQQYAKTFVLNEKTRLCNEFNLKTKECILSPDNDMDKKQHAFKLMLSYIQNKMLEDKDKSLDRDYSEILNARNILEYAKEKESIFYSRYAMNILHKIAFEKWEKDNIVPALNIKLKKEIFYNKEEKQNEELKKFQNYRNFDTDGKYFVSRYYDACCKENGKYNFDSRDYVWQIINNRHNTKPAAQAIKELSLAVKENQDFYFEQLDSFYELLMQRKFAPQTQMPKRHVDTPNDKLSFADLYLEKLGKLNNFKRNSEEEKLDYLTNLTKSEMILLNTEIKKDWYKNDEKYSLLAQVNEQARNSSAFLEMYNELKKININLDEIRIKTNEMTISLKDALENRTVISKQIQEDSAIKLSAQISQMQREYNLLPAEDQKIVDKKIAEIIPSLAGSLIDQKTDSKTKHELEQLSEMIEEKKSTNIILDRTKSILLSDCMRRGINKGESFMQHIPDLLKTTKITNHLSWANLGLNTISEDSPFNEFFDIMPALDPVEAIQDGGLSLAAAAGGIAAKNYISSIATAALANPAVAVAAMAVIAAGGAAIISVKKAKKLEHSQRNLVFEVEI